MRRVLIQVIQPHVWMRFGAVECKPQILVKMCGVAHTIEPLAVNEEEVTRDTGDLHWSFYIRDSPVVCAQ